MTRWKELGNRLPFNHYNEAITIAPESEAAKIGNEKGWLNCEPLMSSAKSPIFIDIDQLRPFGWVAGIKESIPISILKNFIFTGTESFFSSAIEWNS